MNYKKLIRTLRDRVRSQVTHRFPFHRLAVATARESHRRQTRSSEACPIARSANITSVRNGWTLWQVAHYHERPLTVINHHRTDSDLFRQGH
jgi:hypothetical protein